MKKLRMADLEMQPTPLGGQVGIMVDRPELRLASLILEPGETVSAHTAPVEVIFLALAGEGKVIFEEGETAFARGEAVICPAGVSRQITALGKDRFSLIVIRCPNP